MENTTARFLVIEIFEGTPGEIGYGQPLKVVGSVDANTNEELEACVHEYLSRYGMTYDPMFEGSLYGDVSLTVRLDNNEEYSYTVLEL
jgi:hypothetical protein